MNKTITMYELLGLVNNNKAPKKIKISELIYDFDDESQMYFDEGANELSDNIYLTKNLNHPVEILEEEKKIPKKLDIYDELQSLLKDNNIDEHNLHKMLKKIELKQNEIIDCLDYLISKGDE